MSERSPGAQTGSGPKDAEGVTGATGQDLREHREALGGDLSEIAETLRIRREFLEALEAGNYDALPGAAYAVGFVRSYARHLGLDGDQLARQFKIEISGATPTAKLDFLTPVQESRIPRGAIVLIGVLVAVAGYGLWYYLNAKNLRFTDLISEVPRNLMLATETAPPAATAPDEGAPVEKSSPPGEADRDSVPPSPDKMAPAETDATAAEGTAEDPTPSPPPLAAGPEATAPAASADATMPVEPPPTAAPSLEPATPAPAAAEAAEAAPDAVAAAPPDPAPTVAAPSSPAVSPSSATGAARIQLRATADSWVQVRAPSGTLLTSRILRQGSVYVVPPQDGLKLTTGNAGGLEILVDGVPVPALGPYGAVRRNIILDPERLKAGTAYAR